VKKCLKQMRFSKLMKIWFIKSNVFFSGRLIELELQKALASALALTYVSYFEGFGIPIVEAFYAETPVITSNVTSMPEVAGDAALLVDPFSVDEIADALKKLATDEKLREQLINKGKVRRKKFNWQKTADKLWLAIEKTLNQ
jgi:glycosyltransferase involved in cell wall biosynthesis